VQRLGGAQVGDKTMVDALQPAVDAFVAAIESGKPAAQAFAESVPAAQTGAESTADMVARLGRARPLGQKSVGTPDPGATSLALVLETVAKAVA